MAIIPKNQIKQSLPFGGKTFFPTHEPRPIVALCKKINFKQSAVEKMFRMAFKKASSGELAEGLAKLFRVRQVLSKRGEAVGIHRGTHVNTRHSQFTAPRPRDARRARMGGAA
jgi:hypothetical protein